MQRSAVPFPLQILRNAVGKTVSIELTNGEFVNGTVARTDLTMNVVLRNAIRCATDGEHFWAAKETLVRGARIVGVRLDPDVLRVAERGRGAARGRGRGIAGEARGRGRGSTDTASRGRGRGGRGAGRGSRGRGSKGTGKRPRED